MEPLVEVNILFGVKIGGQLVSLDDKSCWVPENEVDALRDARTQPDTRLYQISPKLNEWVSTMTQRLEAYLQIVDVIIDDIAMVDYLIQLEHEDSIENLYSCGVRLEVLANA